MFLGVCGLLPGVGCFGVVWWLLYGFLVGVGLPVVSGSLWC